jgi:prepilin-type N-terminal cleavage/methylation domain-containing protein
VTKKQQPGFTILELTFAIVVIGVMMGIVLTTIIGMLRFYTFSATVRQNQAAGRQVMDDIGRQVRFATLIEPSGATPSATLCVADVKNQKLYRYAVVSEAVQKTTLDYTGTTVPGNCNTGGSVTQTTQSNITPASMHVRRLDFQKTGGARIVVDQDVAGLVVSLGFVNGTADPVTGNCVAGDIYCSRLDFTTSLNIRGKAE